MTRPWPTVFVIGAPAAGKTTIGRAAAVRLSGGFRTIDDWTLRGMPMTDQQIQEALSRLFGSTKPENELVEFSHHDYQGLLRTNTFPIFNCSRKIIVTAPLALCKERNQLRKSRVRNAYIERAWRSAQSLVDTSSTGHAPNVMVVDTSRQSIDAAVAAVISFLTMGRGQRDCARKNESAL